MTTYLQRHIDHTLHIALQILEATEFVGCQAIDRCMIIGQNLKFFVQHIAHEPETFCSKIIVYATHYAILVNALTEQFGDDIEHIGIIAVVRKTARISVHAGIDILSSSLREHTHLIQCHHNTEQKFACATTFRKRNHYIAQCLVWIEMMVNDNPLGAPKSFHHPTQFVAHSRSLTQVEYANQISHVQQIVRERLLLLENHYLLGTVHPLQKIGKIIRHDDRSLLTLLLQILPHSQCRTDRISVG